MNSHQQYATNTCKRGLEILRYASDGHLSFVVFVMCRSLEVRAKQERLDDRQQVCIGISQVSVSFSAAVGRHKWDKLAEV